MTAIDFKKRFSPRNEEHEDFFCSPFVLFVSSWLIFASFRSGAARHEGSGGKPL
jgi:hypothetical protein